MIEDASPHSDGDGRYGDPLFDFEGESREVDIFEQKELLKVGHVPDSTRIVGRDEEIEAVATELRPIVTGEPPNNLIIYGKTGTGKYDTRTRVTRTITRSLNDEAETGLSIPGKGIGSGECYDYLWQLLDDRYDVALMILDEIDRLEDDDALMQLSRARESGKVDCHLGIVAISNKIEYRDGLNERVKSSLREEEFVFQPYDANQLRGIMDHRRDAFREDVLTDDVIPLTAAFAAQEHGDARKAIGILRHAGELAERRNDEMVTEETTSGRPRSGPRWTGSRRSSAVRPCR